MGSDVSEDEPAAAAVQSGGAAAPSHPAPCEAVPGGRERSDTALLLLPIIAHPDA